MQLLLYTKTHSSFIKQKPIWGEIKLFSNEQNMHFEINWMNEVHTFFLSLPLNEEKNIETWKNANKIIMIQKISELLKIIDILICIYVYLTSTSHISFFEKKKSNQIRNKTNLLKTWQSQAKATLFSFQFSLIELSFSIIMKYLWIRSKLQFSNEILNLILSLKLL